MTSATPYEVFAARANETPEATFLRAPATARLPYAIDGFAYSYGEVLQRADALRAQFAAAGYGAGDCVALLLENRPEFFWTWLALNSLGISILPLNEDLRSEELGYELALVQPDLLIAHSELKPSSLAVGGELEILPAGERPRRRAARTRRLHPIPPDTCALLFTSGTTGKPKCCVLSNDYFLRIASWYVSQGGFAEMRQGEETLLTPLPMFHMNALATSTVGMILKGGTIVPLDRFHAQRWWRTVTDAGATIVHYLGVMPAILLKLGDDPTERAHRVRFGFGAGVDPRHQPAFEQRFGFPLVEGWAMTETGGGAVISTAAGPRHVGQRCIGKPAADTQYRIVDDEGRDVPTGTPGELLVSARGDDPRRGFFSGYLGDAAATDEAWAGGWFHSGDVVREGDDGLLFFVDRKKNIVRRSGENIAVVEVEGTLETIDDVAGAAVAPVPDDIRGEEVFALVKLRTDPPADAEAARKIAEAIAHACAERLAYFKVPGYIAFVAALPVTATQKLQRAETRAAAEHALQAPGTIDLRNLKNTLRKSAQLAAS